MLEKKLADDKTKLSNSEKKQIQQQIGILKNKAKTASRGMFKAVEISKKGTSRMSKAFTSLSAGFGKIGWTKASKSMGGIAKSARAAKIANGGVLMSMKGMGKLAGKLVGRAGPIGMLIGIFTFVKKLIFEVNNEITAIGKSLGVSANQARQVRQHFVNISNSSENLLNTYKEISKAQGALNNALGTSATMISGDILDGMATLQNRMGLSEESAVGFAKAALASRSTVKQLSIDATNGALATEKEFGVRVDMNKVLESAGKIQGGLRAIMGANLELIGKTVSKAQLLGMSLEQVAGHSERLLNFQSSIESEMKAELILGKQLNLETARLAALTGDYDTYMSEITKNAGDFFEFSKMNVMQQKFLADALGMSRDELGNMLLQQEDLTALQQKARDAGAEDVLQYQQQLSIQQAFTAAMEKLRLILINVVANIEDMKLPWWLGGGNVLDVSKTVFNAENVNKLTGVTTQNTGGEIVGEANVQDFIIKTHPQDTLVMAGGTRLGGGENNQDLILAIDRNTEAVMQSRQFSYNSFAAAKEERRTTGKFDKKL